MAKLYIPKPCHENWENMTPAQQGKHCAVCDKVVKDLTGLSRIEALQVISNTKEDHICGRVNATVLDQYPGRWKLWMLKTRHWGINVLALIGLISIGKKSAMAQSTTTQDKAEQNDVQFKLTNKKYTVKFRIKDERGDDISFARINIQGKGSKQTDVLTDIDGAASANLNEMELMGNEIKITVSCMGFETQVIDSYTITKQDSTLQIILLTKEVILNTYEVKNNARIMVTVGVFAVETICSSHSCGWVNYPDDTTKTELPPPPQEEPLAFKAYPDPTDGIFTLECNKANIFDVQVFDNSGKMLQTVFQVNRRHQINIGEYAPGIYYARIMENGKLLDTKKIILVK